MTARRELLASGALEAVIGLPPGVLEQSRGPSAVLVITGADDLRPARDRVLFLDLQDLHAREFAAEQVELVSEALDRWCSTGTLSEEGPLGDRAHVVGLDEVIGSGRRASLSLLPGDWVPEVVDEGARVRMRQALEDGPRLLGDAAGAADSAIGQLAGLAVPANQPNEPRWHKLRELIDQGTVELRRAVPQSSLRSNPAAAPADGAAGEIVRSPAWQVEPSSRRPVVTATEGIPHDPRLPVDNYLTRPGDVIVNPVAGAAFGGLKAEVDTEGGRLITHPLEGLRVGVDYQRTLPAIVLRAALEAGRNQPGARGRSAAGKPAPGRVRVQELEVPILEPRETQALEEALGKLDEVRAAGHHLVDTASAMTDGLLEFSPATNPDR